MTDSSSKVEVTIPQGAGTNTVKHDGADEIDVEEGHLLIGKTTASGSIAIYAPGRWISAKVVN